MTLRIHALGSLLIAVSSPSASGSPSTPHQRLHIRTMFQQLELDPLVLTLETVFLFDDSNIEGAGVGQRVDEALGRLSKYEASMLIATLKKELSK